MSWGMTHESLKAHLLAGYSRVYVRCDGRHSRESLGTIVTHTKRSVSVRCGEKVYDVLYQHVKPCTRKYGDEITLPTKEQPRKEPEQMPPDKAPRPTVHQIQMAGAPTAQTHAESTTANIVVIAARLDQLSTKVRDARSQFDKIEAEYKAMKELRDEEMEKVQAAETEYASMQRQLNDAASSLLTRK